MRLRRERAYFNSNQRRTRVSLFKEQYALSNIVDYFWRAIRIASR